MPSCSVLVALLAACVAAGPAYARDTKGFGTVSFQNSCAAVVKADLDTAVARLHDFDDPQQVFRDIAAKDPHCAIAWWGAAMTVRGNPLAGAPDRATLKAGQASIAKAAAAGPTSPREAGLIAAMQVYYRDPDEDHGLRTKAYAAAMRKVADTNPNDPDVQSFYALSILEAVDLTDKSLARQREAGRILERVWADYPDHPGAPHYLIHAFDYPPLAAEALPAARRYAAIAPASEHAQHMPSHIYSMLGLWQESIAANHAAAALDDPGRPHSEAWLDAEEPHGMDFIAYARLQLGQDKAVAQALAQAGPYEERTLVVARSLLERGDWADAAKMPVATGSALDSVTARFVRALGEARSGHAAAARIELSRLRALRKPVLDQEGAYWAGLVDVYAGAADAWIAEATGDRAAAIRLMSTAADADDAREKHILLENKLVPMRELYGELLLGAGRPDDALTAFKASLTAQPNRLRSFLGAARAAKVLARSDEARDWYAKAAALTETAAPGRPEIVEARRGSVSSGTKMP